LRSRKVEKNIFFGFLTPIFLEKNVFFIAFMTKWHEKTDWDRRFLDRIPGFSGLTGFYLKDGDSFRLGLHNKIL
jgi:hypothetical protein